MKATRKLSLDVFGAFNPTHPFQWVEIQGDTVISCAANFQTSGAISQVKQLAAALARSKGLEEGEVTGQLFGRLSLTLMRANALMLSSRRQDADFPLPEVDGVH